MLCLTIIEAGIPRELLVALNRKGNCEADARSIIFFYYYYQLYQLGTGGRSIVHLPHNYPCH